MIENNSTSHLFRFLQLRPSAATVPGGTVALQADSPFATKLVGSAPSGRPKLAREYASELRRSVEALVYETSTRQLLVSAREAAANKVTVREFRATAATYSRSNNLVSMCATISDYLLAGKFAGTSTVGLASDVVELFHVLDVLSSEKSVDDESNVAEAFRRPIVLPSALEPARSRGVRRGGQPVRAHDTAIETRRYGWHARVEQTLRELLTLFTAQAQSDIAARQNDSATTVRPPVMATLIAATAQQISAASREVLRALAIDVTSRPILSVAMELENALRRPARDVGLVTMSNSVEAPGPGAAFNSSAAQMRPSGIADLLIVKRHLLAYVRSDIAHVENVMAKEKRERKHRLLERMEQTFITEREQTDTKENELQTAEQFELQQETQETIHRDMKVGFGLTVSGKYGPAVEFSSSVQVEASQSTEESTRSALTYAKDVVERSLQRVTQRVREEQIRKIIRESEESNTHAFDNASSAHVVGSYQYLEKEYECQIFNYGIRQMFDFMIPEPASYIWHLEQSPGSDIALPPAPPKLQDFVTSANDIHLGNYRELAAKMGTRGIEPPPPLVKYSSVSLTHGETGDEEGKPRSVVGKEIAIPDGYVPWFAIARPVALTDDDLNLAITIGSETQVYRPRNAALYDLDGLDLGTATLTYAIVTSLNSLYDAQSKVQLQVIAYESNTYSVTVEVTFVRTENAYAAWQIKTFEALAQSSREQQAAYDQQVADLRARARADAVAAATQFDAPPSEHQRIIKNELKKHSISTITQQWYTAPNGLQPTDPPTFDLGVAASQGAFIRFFEQAFEWDQLQYVCYPYFWAQQETWGARFQRNEVDPVFLEFLQAGSARVIVPVRPGFEIAVMHFLETLELTGTGEIWNGAGTPPGIHSDLYVSIVQELQERTDAPQSEIAVGAPWRVQLPTPLVMLRSDASLPRWQRASLDGWDWSETP